MTASSKGTYSFGDSQNRQIGIWLLVCAAMVFAMTVLGGLTRLTHSGLSIVTWEPLAGILPPLSPEAWVEEFENYKQFPEYQKINMGMSLAGFKAIFWYEFSHRLLGRAIGLVFAIPFIYFLVKRQVDQRLGLRLGALFVLGGMQGVLGWYMVSSGLVDRPDVSQYRLTAHLGLAVLIYGYMIWLAMAVLIPMARPWGEAAPLGFRAATYAIVGSVFVLILSGGLVAGLDAGFAYNTYPTMDGAWVPAGMLTDPFGNITTVQFLHRWLGPAMAILVVLVWGRGLDLGLPPRAMAAHYWVVFALAAQGAIGIGTLILVVPVPLASLHQGVALVVFTVAIVAAFLTDQARLNPTPGIKVLP
ncbi:MAG: heme A synthase [Alphaproteobacteria bacterium]|jgi:heme a synthase|nr:heme A synthase [Alphaproteobacteria bacterium]MBT4711459.1 heme A synthase [Alphaproteobacteria bacterium]